MVASLTVNTALVVLGTSLQDIAGWTWQENAISLLKQIPRSAVHSNLIIMGVTVTTRTKL